MSVSERFMSAFDRLRTFLWVYGRFLPLIFIIRIPVERLKQVIKRSKTLRNAHKTIEIAQERSETVSNGERSETVRKGQERSGTVSGQER